MAERKPTRKGLAIPAVIGYIALIDQLFQPPLTPNQVAEYLNTHTNYKLLFPDYLYYHSM